MNAHVAAICVVLLFAAGVLSATAAEHRDTSVDCSQSCIPFTPEWHTIHDFEYDYTNEYGVIVYKPRPIVACDDYKCEGV